MFCLAMMASKIHALNEMTLGNKASFIKEIIKKNESKKR